MELSRGLCADDSRRIFHIQKVVAGGFGRFAVFNFLSPLNVRVFLARVDIL